MKSRVVLVLTCTVLVAASGARGQTGGAYSLSWNTLSSGGGAAGAGVYQMKASLGQLDAGRLAGGAYVLNGGFSYPGLQGTTAVEGPGGAIPLGFASSAPVPNPFHDGVVLGFDLPVPRKVRVAIFALDGRRVRMLMDDTRDAGRYRIAWNGLDDAGHAPPAGIYFVRITAGEFTASHRMVRLR